ncbi:cupin domain-containing protein [Fructobacillus sp. M1-13]|uniref:Cupin domain-containing protein n=1 Tax=Fructobacillus papyriferae TaxID=2713171 RepID=A0ABS5QP81_9LACO|nr:cupin domain-containing protein [Fructobacillus papyriferae]MBS9334687.1 cupin domain-containing protein [Fructobacillus papyriferae]MCD2158677.1 cupin domain-containing protein [Fructobacillus papyriferae]
MTKFDELVNGGIFGKGIENPYGKYFIGDTFLNALTSSPDDQIGIGTVTFKPGSRNNWHIHHDGYQILLVTDGEGWYQEEGKPAQSLKQGDVIVTKDGVKHWHGAKADSWFEHIAITAGTPEWLEPVDDETYNNL